MDTMLYSSTPREKNKSIGTGKQSFFSLVMLRRYYCTKRVLTLLYAWVLVARSPCSPLRAHAPHASHGCPGLTFPTIEYDTLLISDEHPERPLRSTERNKSWIDATVTPIGGAYAGGPMCYPSWSDHPPPKDTRLRQITIRRHSKCKSNLLGSAI